MSDRFFEKPILNSPYAYPSRHWELDAAGQPTQNIVESRRRSDFITPIPKARKRRGTPEQKSLGFDEGKGLSTADQQYAHTAMINSVRREVDRWRGLPNLADWRVTPETARLLQHWRHHPFGDIRPFFCQIEAVETAIWLTEVAPQMGKAGEQYLAYLANANAEANPGLMRLALKLATGADKTTVMAMLIAWQSVNANRHPQSRRFTRGFLVVAPGITIKDRLRVLQPNDPDSYYASRELVPGDMLDDIRRAKIVVTNYHAFKLRERMEVSKGGRSLLQGRGEPLRTLETEGQMLQRVMPDLLGLRNIMVINDEAHHCYREKAKSDDTENLKGDERKEAEKNNEAARLWISGLETVGRKLGIARVIDLSATPFFLRGSGYAEGTLFPWTMSDFSLMDAIECGIVKLPRVPTARRGESVMPSPKLKPENLAPLVVVVRGERVLLDSDLAALYGVEARVLNQAVARNRNRFPEDFMFRLSAEEYEAIRSRLVTASAGKHSNPSQIVMSSRGRLRSRIVISKGRGGRRYLPYAFTEQGVAMLSSVLRSARAVEVNIAIMRTFVQLRRLMDSNRELARRIEAMEEKYDEQFAVVFDAIKKLIAEDDARKTRPKRPIGFIS